MTKVQYHRGFLVFAVLSFSVAAWVILLRYLSPTELVTSIGINNGYLVAFFVALLGGTSSLTGVSFVAVIATLAAGGLNPFLLALFAGVGIAVSDSMFFWIGRNAHDAIDSPLTHQYLEKISIWINDRSRLVVGIFIYIYTALTPLPTDILTTILGLAHQPYRFVAIPLLLGGITFAYLVATLGSYFIVL